MQYIHLKMRKLPNGDLRCRSRFLAQGFGLPSQVFPSGKGHAQLEPKTWAVALRSAFSSMRRFQMQQRRLAERIGPSEAIAHSPHQTVERDNAWLADGRPPRTPKNIGVAADHGG